MGTEPRVVSAGPGASRGRGLHRGATVFGGLAKAALLVAMLAVTLVGCSSQGTSEPSVGARASATTLAVTSSPTPSPTPAATPPGPTASPSHFPAWSGAPGYVLFPGRLDADFGWAEVTRNPYSDTGSNGHATVSMKLYLTYDGGASWVDRTPATDSPYSFLYKDLHFADPLHAWFMEDVNAGGNALAGDEVNEHWLYRTGDGGVTWTRYHVPLPPTYVATDLDMADGVHGLVTTAGNDQREQLWGTSDGGATWTKLMDVLGAERLDFPLSPTMVSAAEGWALRSTDGGNGRAVLHSTDGGRSWQSTAPLPLPTGMTIMWWVRSASGWARPASPGSGADWSIDGMVVMTGGSWSYVTWVSHDGGATWAIGSSTPLGKGNLTFLSARYIGLVTTGPITYFGISSPGSAAVFDGSGACRGTTKMFFTLASLESPDDAWATCTYTTVEGWVDHSYFYRTEDGGQTWMPMMGAP